MEFQQSMKSLTPARMSALDALLQKTQAEAAAALDQAQAKERSDLLDRIADAKTEQKKASAALEEAQAAFKEIEKTFAAAKAKVVSSNARLVEIQCTENTLRGQLKPLGGQVIDVGLQELRRLTSAFNDQLKISSDAATQLQAHRRLNEVQTATIRFERLREDRMSPAQIADYVTATIRAFGVEVQLVKIEGRPPLTWHVPEGVSAQT